MINNQILFKTSHKEKIIFTLIITITLIVVLLGLKPAGMQRNSSVAQIVLSSYLIINYIIIHIIFLFFLPKLRFFTERLKTLKYLIFYNLFLSISLIITSILIVYFLRPIVYSNHTVTIFFAISSAIIIVNFISSLIVTKFFIKETSISNINSVMIIQDHSKIVKILLNDFTFAKACDNYIEIYTINSKPHLFRLSLKQFLEQNPLDQLYRCHKSYIINKKKITTITGNTKGYKAEINGTVLPVSRNKGVFLSNLLK
ncbi:MAG: LytTR family transcriptional regulator [Bacteroidetes bacterium]|nr:LytTR family transcriptional regulator [Cytophagia bacterium]MBT5990516.1 LytTR family transcriptional regulator [Bacteroidota bacterium]MBT7827163.1 LytTR family transcriptional regulator [Bacteroidota bacterium]